ncbi:MAG: hypothetical protein MSG64_11545 [Pyrinomonadaceae bacterium MAG19_C2-C3]|nr:hypothetical protein [Pyrinomonadaceae bacterium MAG19_C2-C3]
MDDILGTAFAVCVKRNKTRETDEPGALIRVTVEQWEHTLESHPHDFSFSDYEIILDAIADPDYILRGQTGTRVAVVNYGKSFLHVIYRELNEYEGFFITAFYKPDFDRKIVIWRKYEQDRDD